MTKHQTPKRKVRHAFPVVATLASRCGAAAEELCATGRLARPCLVRSRRHGRASRLVARGPDHSTLRVDRDRGVALTGEKKARQAHWPASLLDRIASKGKLRQL